MSNNIIELEWTREVLWKGCMLASLAHAIMVAHYPDLSNEHSWDGMNYSVQDTEGARGTITFHPQYCVAAFRDDNSERVENRKKAVDYFKGAPREIVKLAETEALQYLLDSVDGKIVPVITTSFWGTDDKLFSTDSFDLLIKNGGFLLENQAMNVKSSIDAWKEYYDMSIDQCSLLESIYNRRLVKQEGILTLIKDEVAMIGTDDEEGLAESRTSFEEIGIAWED